MDSSNVSQTAPYYFISYCRQEVTFVDNFSRELQKRGVRNWVDFRNLVPGHSWQTQLDDGVNNAAAILLVVSKAAMASGPVKDEWTKSLAAGKRIILIIFEPCQLDPGLAGLEWVDFTHDFKRGMDQLAALLPKKQPEKKLETLPPQVGVRPPGAANWFSCLSVLTVLLAVFGCFLTLQIQNEVQVQVLMSTFNINGQSAPPPESGFRDMILMGLFVSVFLFWIPAIWNFIRIPKGIRNRTYNAGQIKSTLNGLTFASLFMLIIPLSITSNMWSNVDMTEAIGGLMPPFVILMLVLFAVSFILNRLLASSSMYRWAGPAGALIRVVRPDLKKHLKNERKFKVAVDYAPQDKRYAQELKSAITKAGHAYTENIQESDIVLPLLSQYKSSSIANPEEKRVIPVLLQTCDVDPRLSQVQWIDLRYGKASIDAVANLLDEPDELMRVLGVLPVRTTILPAGVTRLRGLLSLVLTVSVLFALLTIGDVIARVQYNGLSMLADPAVLLSFSLMMILPVLVVVGVYFLRQYIINRKLKNFPFLSYGKVWGLAVLLAILVTFSQWGWDLIWLTAPFAWLVPLLMLTKESRMWLPAK